MDDDGRHAGGSPGPAEWLTVPGRLLLIATLAGAAGTFYFYFMQTYGDLPAGRYPVLLWVVPVAAAAVAFFFIASLLLQRLGVRIYRKEPDRK